MPSPHQIPPTIHSEVVAYYQKGNEASRLQRGIGQLEFLRTQEIILRYLPTPPVDVLDVGGGAGIYSLWLARLGYQVHLVDLTPLHIEQAQAASRLQPSAPIASFTVGDARHLDRGDASADVVLFLGPLYHLTDAQSRLDALREARRALKPGGVAFIAAISKFASTLDGFQDGSFADPDFGEIMKQDLANGQHRNPHPDRDYFTTAYFHHPTALKAEIEQAGLHVQKLLAVEGPGWLLRDFETQWQQPNQRESLLEIIRRVEEEPTLIGMSCHLMVVATK